jgi:hypothetical protein
VIYRYNQISTAIFDFVMAPFGHDWAFVDLVIWPVIMGIGALQVYKMVSNQKAITNVKRQISMHLLEIRLFRNDIVQVLVSTGKIVLKNFLYIGHNLVPMAVMLAPMIAVMVQLVAHYAYEPSDVGAVEVLHVKLDTDSGMSSRDVSLTIPAGISLEAPVVRTAMGEVFWRLRADQPGDYRLDIKVGDETFEKEWAVGGDARKVPVKRLRGWEAILYPGEPAIPSGAPIESIELASDTRSLDFFPDGEGGILIWAMLLSIVAGIALKDLFGVTL